MKQDSLGDFMKKTTLLCLLLFVPLPLQAYDRITGLPFASRSEVIAQNGMVTTSQPLATQVGLDILKQGGNAIDAAIAANAVLGLLEPTGGGIGGDLFAIVWDAKTQKLYGLNASGRSPQSLTLEHFTLQGLDSIPTHGPLPVTVPGAVDGWFELHTKFGGLPMTTILQPAIEYAKNGFPVTELIAYQMQHHTAELKQFSGFAETYMANGKTPKKGQLFTNKALAVTYEKIATGGRDVFYKGDIARTIAAYMKQQGGYLSYDDLANHQSEWVEPVSTNYKGFDVWQLPDNAQGIAALQMLNLLELFDVQDMGFASEQYIHTFVEAKKLAFADRAKYFVDPAFSDKPINSLLAKKYAKQQTVFINNEQAAKRYDAGIDDGDAVYLTTADKDGNMVSLIQSNYRGMGSGMTPSELGFVLQNRGQLFSLKEGHANVYAPDKRPFHTDIPAFITRNGQPWISFGVTGGAVQPQMHAQIVVNLIDFGMNLQEAGDAPRMLHVGSVQPSAELISDAGFVSLESAFDYTTKRKLLSKGHVMKEQVGVFGGYQAIMRDLKSGVYYGASESRKDGQAAGF